MEHETVNKICQILTCSYQLSDKQSVVVHIDCKEVNVHLDYLQCKMDVNKNDIRTSYVDAWFDHHPISKATEHMLLDHAILGHFLPLVSMVYE